MSRVIDDPAKLQDKEKLSGFKIETHFDSSISFHLNEQMFISHRVKIMEFLHRLKDTVTCVEFNSSCFLSETSMIALITPFHGQLEKLTISRKAKWRTSITEWPALSLNKLKHLEVTLWPWPMKINAPKTTEASLSLPFICHILTATTESLEKFKLGPNEGTLCGDDPYKQLRETLATQSNLKELSISDNKFYNEKIVDLKFQLQKLTSFDRYDPQEFTIAQIKNFKAFLITQKNVELNGCEIAKMIQLPVKSINDAWFFFDGVMESTREDLERNNEVFMSNPLVVKYSFYLEGLRSDSEVADTCKVIHKLYPNIRELNVDDIVYGFYDYEHLMLSQEDYLEPLNVFEGVEKLKIKLIYSVNQLAMIKIPSLKSITVTCLNEEESDFTTLHEFIKFHQNLEEINIKHENGGFANKGISELMQFIREHSNKNFKSINFTASFHEFE